MTLLPLDELLALVGQLDDSLGPDTARERFRRYLRAKLTTLDLLGDYIAQCAGKDGVQYDRALQDLVNLVGVSLGFDVSFGPYQGLPGQIGFDGRWKTSEGLDVFVELKTDETFSARRPTLARSIERLISEGEVADWAHALGLYVMANEGIVSTHLEKLILDEPQMHQLRTISLASLQILARLVNQEALSQPDVITLLRSASPSTDSQVALVSRLANHRGDSEPERKATAADHDEPRTEPRPQPADLASMFDCTLERIAAALNAFFGIDAPEEADGKDGN